MKRSPFIALILMLGMPAFSQSIKAVCSQLNELNKGIIIHAVPKPQAAARFKQLMSELKAAYPLKPDNQPWIFPLKGYTAGAIGGKHGSGYSDNGYHFFDGNKHTAHPAHDIFIHDHNQDGIDDRTQRPVDVLAVTGGVVIACSNQWQPGSSLRGGKYICIYHPQQNIITYYAHNHTIMVQPGDMVHAGQKIAEVGRTGFNAYQKRSPTHLHFSAYHLTNGLPVPFNCYVQLNQSHYL